MEYIIDSAEQVQLYKAAYLAALGGAAGRHFHKTVSEHCDEVARKFVKNLIKYQNKVLEEDEDG